MLHGFRMGKTMVTNKTMKYFSPWYREVIEFLEDNSTIRKASAHASCNYSYYTSTLLVKCACQPLDDATAPACNEQPKGGMGFLSLRVYTWQAASILLVG